MAGRERCPLADRAALPQVLWFWLSSDKPWVCKRALQVCAQLLEDCRDGVAFQVRKDAQRVPPAARGPGRAALPSCARAVGSPSEALWGGPCAQSWPEQGAAGRRKGVLGPPPALVLPLAPADKRCLPAVWRLGGIAGASDL